ncbi:MAG TPA: PhzF family phenazine biosynthesis protein [Candidatus Limnocylindrales bacterium]|nr:PhzF family phenazine biosynthesis protein [Candidatus Limnocylindrales bacterium]
MARELEIVWVDAFTTTPLQGNACAVVLDARGLGDDAMLAIAREINLSETSFVFPGDADADVVVRYWMPVGEIPLAGHPTIATVHALREAGAFPPGRDTVRVKMPAATVPVTIRDGVYAMSQPPPRFLGTVPRAQAAAALRLRDDELYPGVTPQTVSTGTPQLMIALASRDALDRADPDRRALFPRDREWLSVHVFTPCERDVALVARHFADVGDILEDPFTGSATGGMAGYCARYGIVRERAYDVMQGMHVHRPGRAHVEVGGDPPDAIGRITVAGPAVTVMRATMRLP